MPTVRHLSMLTDSAYYEDQDGNLNCNLKFEEKLRGVVTLAKKLRTLVLIGRYDSSFFQSFKDVFKEAPYLRMLQISSTHADTQYFECELVNSTHLCYLKLERKRSVEDSLPGFEESSSMDDGNSSQSSEHVINTARAVVECLQPCDSRKHIHISGYSGATSPAWFGTSVTCLQTLHLEDCGKWKILPSLGSLQFLTKLVLRNMQSVIEVSLPSLEELVLIKMPKLERCS